jgi:hypothetical protein
MIRLLALLLGVSACFALAACNSVPTRTAAEPPVAPVVRVFLETVADELALRVQLPRSGVALPVGRGPVFLETDLVDAEVAEVELGRCLLLQFSGRAAQDLYRLTARASGRRLVVSIDGEFLGARRIESALGDGQLLVFLEVPDERLVEIVGRVKLAAQRAPVEQGRPRA